MMTAKRWRLAAVLVLVMSMGLIPAQPVSAEILEELRYRVDVSIMPDAIRSKVVLKRLDGERLWGAVIGESQGILAKLSGNWKGVFSTEMIFREGKLHPLIYREESSRGSKRNFKEYRFDYQKNTVELWQYQGGQLVKKWETTFTTPPSDGISLFYNQRLGFINLNKGGETVKVMGIPYPKPEEIIVRIGPLTPEGRKIWVSLYNKAFEESKNQIQGLMDAEGVPTKAESRVLKFGKVSGAILPESKRLNDKDLGLKSEGKVPAAEK
ncbi:MAG: DUF3108 domain-containing protein [Deltaproteobacteria bacterium]|nr:DUF3108 domain-containing protein [Deltaproteobacteria bacterium]